MQPAISVVVPTHGRPERLERCLEALAAQDLPRPRFEVRVVVDGGPDPAYAPLRERPGPDPALALHWHDQPRSGPAAARNRGARESRGRFLAFTDDDCRPRPDWLSTLLTGLERRVAEDDRAAPVLGGATVNALGDVACSVASQDLVDRFTAERLAAGRPFFASSNIALPRALFLRVGGFDDRFPLAAGEDRDLCERLLAAGARLEPASAAVVDHYHHLDLAGFLRQHYRYGRGARRFRSLDAPDRRGFESLGFYLDLVFHPLLRRRPRALRLCSLLALSQGAQTVGYLVERLAGGGRR